MNLKTLKKNMTRKALILALPFLLLLGVAAPSAQARDHHHGNRHHGNRHAYRHGHYGRGDYYRHHGYGHRNHHGYWRRHNGHRYWYENGGYYSAPGGVSISIGL